MRLMDRAPWLAAVVRGFEHERRPNADAIQQMALENYLEMREAVMDPDIARRKRRKRSRSGIRMRSRGIRWSCFIPRFRTQESPKGHADLSNSDGFVSHVPNFWNYLIDSVLEV